MRKFLSLVVLLISQLLFLPCISHAAVITVRGTAKGAENLKIRLIGYTDYITYERQTLAQAIIDPSGQFLMEFKADKITHAILKVQFYESEIFLEPGETYVLQLENVVTGDEFRPYYNSENLVFSILNKGKDELNHCIYEFAARYNDFVMAHFDAIYKFRKANMIDSVHDIGRAVCSELQNNYFNDYRLYKTGSLELSVKAAFKAKLFGGYFGKKPVLYEHPEYMYFFNEYFDQYYSSSRGINTLSLQNAINKDKSYQAVDNVIGNDTLLKDERFRELVLLKMLYQLYYEQGYNSSGIFSILEHVKSLSKFPEHRQIAGFIIKKLLKLQPGYHVPQTPLISTGQKAVELSDFTGKPVFLAIFTLKSFACLAETEGFSGLHQKYNGKMHFLPVFFDEPDIVKKFMAEKGYSWTAWLPADSDQLIENFDLKTFPLFVLLDAKGNIFQYPARKPSENVEYVIEGLLKKMN
ncbi:MAG: TlpA family protein disulfide reductase [Bacteroidales bacterium]|nr:TlpA family protein disulfide reductase [Bacteroidales bacterium]